MTEKRFWRMICDVWPGHAMRIEASYGGVDPGTPDSHLSLSGRGMFIELKVWPEEVTAVQIAWHVDALQRGAGVELWSLMPDRRIWAGDAERYAKFHGKPSPAGLALGFHIVRIQNLLLSRAS